MSESIEVILKETEKPKNRILAISSAVSILAVSAGIINGSLQWVEEAKARQAEIELRAAAEFLVFMERAHNRSSYVVSEKCIEHLGKKIAINGDSSERAMKGYNTDLESACVINTPVGKATQEASIEMIASFGIKFDFLRNSAKEALLSLERQKVAKDTAVKALSRLNKNSN